MWFRWNINRYQLICFIQLDIITRTIAILDNRLTLTEDRISSLLAHQRGLVTTNVHTVGGGNESRGAFLTQQDAESGREDNQIEEVGYVDHDDHDDV